MRLALLMLAWVRFVIRGDGGWPARWQDRLFRGHVSIGPITIYGANAMHWAINVRFRGSYWCLHPTTRTNGGYWPWYFYISPDATPRTATFKIGPRFARRV